VGGAEAGVVTRPLLAAIQACPEHQQLIVLLLCAEPAVVMHPFFTCGDEVV
jgi:hypothetical protein